MKLNNGLYLDFLVCNLKLHFLKELFTLYRPCILLKNVYRFLNHLRPVDGSNKHRRTKKYVAGLHYSIGPIFAVLCSWHCCVTDAADQSVTDQCSSARIRLRLPVNSNGTRRNSNDDLIRISNNSIVRICYLNQVYLISIGGCFFIKVEKYASWNGTKGKGLSSIVHKILSYQNTRFNLNYHYQNSQMKVFSFMRSLLLFLTH